MFKTRFYMAFVVILILIAGLSWVAVQLEEKEAASKPKVEYWLPENRKLSTNQTIGKEIFWEQCYMCHRIGAEGGGIIIKRAVNDYEEFLLKRFLEGDHSMLKYAEFYGMRCVKPEPALTEEQINRLIDFLNTLK